MHTEAKAEKEEKAEQEEIKKEEKRVQIYFYVDTQVLFFDLKVSSIINLLLPTHCWGGEEEEGAEFREEEEREEEAS